ncbi:MAG: CapA family protein [Candidatus Cloacimonetes bacterium]|nr:CapA family protein [Candidatus Cloacimonadota bacterium]MCF7814919.1 CapA family protein [Candidatus Cloacimonadota bacterium]
MEKKINKMLLSIILFKVIFFLQSCSLQPNPRYNTNPEKANKNREVHYENNYSLTADEEVDFGSEELEEIISQNIDVDDTKLESSQIRIMTTGDIMLGTRIPNESYYPTVGDALFSDQVKTILKRGDIVFGNLEGAICGETGKPRNKKYVFAMPDVAASWLADAGFNLLSVANNHAGDMGDEGCINTKKMLENYKIKFAGYLDYPSTSFITNDIRIGFVATSPNAGVVYLHDLDWLTSKVRGLALQNDIVIVSMHIGAEGKDHQHITRKDEKFLGENRGDPYHFARKMIDAGADLVLGHGPHVTRAIDIYKGRFIAYSLGNFCTYSRVNIRGVNGIAPILELVLDRNGEFQFGSIHSTKQISRQGVRIDHQNEVLKKIIQLTNDDIPETDLMIDENGFITVK